MTTEHEDVSESEWKILATTETTHLTDEEKDYLPRAWDEWIARVRRDAKAEAWDEGAQAQADTYGGQIDTGPVDPPAQDPTDAEVLAALNADYAIRFGPRNLPADSLEPYGEEAVRIMRAALSAARATRRDEETP